MFPRTLPILFLSVLLATHAPAQSPTRSTKGRGSSQTSAAYTPKVKAAMGKRWASELAPRMAEFSQGDLNVTFKLDAEGNVTGFTVLKNTSNDAFAKFCEQFVRGTKFEKPSASSLTEGQLEIPFTFTIL